MVQRAIPGAGQIEGLTLGRVKLPSYDPDYVDITELYKLKGEQEYKKKALDVEREGIEKAEASSLAAIEATDVRAKKAADLKKELAILTETGAKKRLKTRLESEGILAEKQAELKKKQDLYGNIIAGTGLTLSGISLAKEFWPDATKSAVGATGEFLKPYVPAAIGAGAGYSAFKDEEEPWKGYAGAAGGAVAGEAVRRIGGYYAGGGSDIFGAIFDEVSGWFD